MSNDVIGVRLTRNAPVLFVDGNRLTLVPGDLVVIELFDGETGIGASVVVGAGQLLDTAAGKLAGRALRAC